MKSSSKNKKIENRIKLNDKIDAGKEILFNNKLSVESNLELLHKIFLNITESIVIVDVKGLIHFSNRSFMRLFNISEESIKGVNISDFFLKDERAKILSKLDKARSVSRSCNLSLSGIRRDNKELYVKLNILPISNHKNPLFLLNIVDLTKEEEETDKIDNLEKLASIGTFASGIVHEFNNVLTGIKGYSQLAKQDLANADLVKKAFDIIEAESQRGAELCRNMTLYSSRTKINPEPTNIKELIETVLSLQEKYFIQENIKVVKNIENVPIIKVDKAQIQQVLLNIIINARHAILQKGLGKITVSLKESKTDIIIQIEDDGIGIEKKNISRIFDPFYTSKGPIGINHSGKEIKGSGLGLSVSLSIVRKHKGTIKVSSTPSIGSCFSIIIPKVLAVEETKQETMKDYYNYFNSNKSYRVLVVDDEMSIREMLFRALTEINMDVTLAKDAEEAEALCKSEVFDLIFVDYILPEMNGDKLVPIIKSYLPNSKIVFISGWMSSPLKKKNLENSVYAWIEKPFDITEIFNCIKELGALDADKIRH